MRTLGLSRPAARLFAAVLLALAAAGPRAAGGGRRSPALAHPARRDGPPRRRSRRGRSDCPYRRLVEQACAGRGRPVRETARPHHRSAPPQATSGRASRSGSPAPDGAVHESTFTFPFPVLPEPTRNAAQLEFHAPQPPASVRPCCRCSSSPRWPSLAIVGAVLARPAPSTLSPPPSSSRPDRLCYLGKIEEGGS